jgi:hypothetical protein
MSMKTPKPAHLRRKARSFEVLLKSPEEPVGTYSATIKPLDSPTDVLEDSIFRFAESVLDLVGDLLVELTHDEEPEFLD